MKKRLVLGALCLLSWSHLTSSRAEETDYSALVNAISDVESGGDPRAIGPAGERGLMQIREATWRETTLSLFGEEIPYERAFEPDLNQQVGHAYLAKIASQLHEQKEKLDEPLLAVLVASYHCGPSRLESVGYSTRRLSARAQDYVERVLRLHQSYQAEKGR